MTAGPSDELDARGFWIVESNVEIFLAEIIRSPLMLLITFLGTTNYREALYGHDGCTYATRFYAHALPRFFPEISQTKVFATAEAEEAHGAVYRQLWEHDSPLEFVHIASGKSVGELWAIFDQLVAEIPQGEEVVFDVTLAFRSLPIVATLAIAYLRSTRNVKVHSVVYGAFEATSADGITPTFDLTPMLKLFEWIEAVERFENHSDGRPIQRLLADIQNAAYRSKQARPPRLLKTMGDQLGQFTSALVIGRVREVIQVTPSLCEILRNQNLAEETRIWAKPLSLLLEPLSQFMENFAASSEFEVDAQRRLARFYADREMYAVAVSVFREYLVSRACELSGMSQSEIVDQKRRAVIERTLSAYSLWKRGDLPAGDIPENWPDWLSRCDEAGLIHQLGQIFEVRNDVNHVGMRSNDQKSTKLIERIKSVILDAEEADSNDTDSMIRIDLSELFQDTGTAKLSDLPTYESLVRSRVSDGAKVVLSGAAPVWLYLRLGHVLHGKAMQLYYDSPVTGAMLVFDHSPY